jgi:hypothetical protein
MTRAARCGCQNKAEYQSLDGQERQRLTARCRRCTARVCLRSDLAHNTKDKTHQTTFVTARPHPLFAILTDESFLLPS